MHSPRNPARRPARRRARLLLTAALLGATVSGLLAAPAHADGSTWCIFSTFDLPDGQVGTAYPGATMTIDCITNTGDDWGIDPVVFSTTPLPDGLVIDPTTGEITGTPTTPVVDLPVTITRTYSNGWTEQATDTITILPDDPGVPIAHPVAIGGASLAAASMAWFGFRRRRVAVCRTRAREAAS